VKAGRRVSEKGGIIKPQPTLSNCLG